MSEEKEEYKPVPLAVMLEDAEDIVIKGARYQIRPLYLQEVREFQKDGLSIGPQFINIVDEERAKTLDKWLKRTVYKSGANVTLDELLESNWTVKDLRKVVQKLIDISG
ncbi:MAG: hypothetical protein ACM3MK_06960 [Chitinophagales bacterium]